MKLGPYELNTIVTGDARELAKGIPDELVDLIFTDPPYPKQYLPLYGWLAETAARVLKPGGFLCAMTGGYHLDKVFSLMSGKGLNYYFKIEILNGGDAPVIYPRRIVTRTKPVLMWTKGPAVIELWNMTDVYQGQGKDKRFHRWGQEVGSARYCIEYILGSGAKGVLLEPFTGGGSTLVACKALGVDYVGFEIDAEVAEQARIRLGDVGYIPPMQKPEQLALGEWA